MSVYISIPRGLFSQCGGDNIRAIALPVAAREYITIQMHTEAGRDVLRCYFQPAVAAGSR